MRISILTSGHYPFDDRIFFHLGMTLSDKGHEVEIVSSKSGEEEVSEGISLNCFEGDTLKKKEKIRSFRDRLKSFNPDLVICAEPLTLIAAGNYKKKDNFPAGIIYDITEWYPSEKNLAPYFPAFRWLVFLKLLVFNIYATDKTNAFIFGEWYKSRPYRILFPYKPFIFLSYYPDLKYVEHKEPALSSGRLRLSWSGKMSREKGFLNFIQVVNGVADKDPGLKIEVKIIGWFETESDRILCEPLLRNQDPNISFLLYERQPFRQFLTLIRDTDIFIDLRSDRIENQNSLPIKLFYYAALGRPVIFSDLKAIRKEVRIENFGHLVKPGIPELPVDIIFKYLHDSELYFKHANNARKMAEEIYNWGRIKPALLSFIDSFRSS